VTFESNSKLLQIESRAFNECSSLPSICIPSSVKILYARCFDQCSSLSNVTFGPSSRLSQIEEGNSDGSDAGHISPTEKNLRKKCFNRCPNPIFHNLPRIEAQNPS
jgi:hypothetical protein